MPDRIWEIHGPNDFINTLSTPLTKSNVGLTAGIEMLNKKISELQIQVQQLLNHSESFCTNRNTRQGSRSRSRNQPLSSDLKLVTTKTVSAILRANVRNLVSINQRKTKSQKV